MRYTVEQQRVICDWLSAHGIVPGLVPLYSTVKVHDGHFTVRVRLLRDGKPYLTADGEIAETTVTKPMRTPPPPVFLTGPRHAA